MARTVALPPGGEAERARIILFMRPVTDSGTTSSTQRMARLEAVHVCFLGFWAGALVLTAVTAALTFPVMRDLDPVLHGYPGAEDDHWLIVGGHIAAPLFELLAWVQLVCLACCGASLLAMSKAGWRTGGRRRVRLRLVVLGLSAVLAVYYAGWLVPRMNGNLETYWSAAQDGFSATVNTSRKAFDADHPLASRLLGATLVCVTASLGLAIALPIAPSVNKQEAS